MRLQGLQSKGFQVRRASISPEAILHRIRAESWARSTKLSGQANSCSEWMSPPQHAEGVDIGQAGGVQVVALADAARGLPGDGLAQQGAGRRARPRTGRSGPASIGLGGRVKPPCRCRRQAGERRGSAAMSCTARSIQAAAWASGTRTLKRTTALSATTFRAPPPEILATLTVTPSRWPFRPCRRGGEDGGAGDGVAALVEGAARVGGLAGDDQVAVAAALAGAGQRAVGQGRLIGQAEMAARAQLGQQGRGGGRADLLVRATAARSSRRGPCPGGSRRPPARASMTRDAALHVGDAGAVQGAVGARGRRSGRRLSAGKTVS